MDRRNFIGLKFTFLGSEHTYKTIFANKAVIHLSGVPVNLRIQQKAVECIET